MKLNIIKSAVFLMGMMFAAISCVKQDFEKPTYQYADTSLLKPVISIADLFALNPTGALTKIDTFVYLKATVIANDKTGNYYKQLIVQDSTAGLEIDIRATGTYLKYQIGQLVYVKCKGLYLGRPGGAAYKLGSVYNGGVGQIPEPVIDDFIFPAAGGQPIKPRMKPFGFVPSSLGTDYNTLIKFENVQFRTSELKKTFADYKNKITSDIVLTDCNKKEAIVRTSGYATFAAQPIPQGNGDITVIYNTYSNAPQLFIRDIAEVSMENERCGAFFEDDFSLGISTFTQYSVSGNELWTYNSQYKCMIMSGYSGGNKANEDWLISPSLDLTTLTTPKLSFVHSCNLYTGGSWTMMGVKVSKDYTGGNPSTATWTDLTGYSMPTTFTFVPSGDMDISAFAGNSNVHFAFYYKSTTSGAPKWEVKSAAVSFK